MLHSWLVLGRREGRNVWQTPIQRLELTCDNDARLARPFEVLAAAQETMLCGSAVSLK